MRVVFTETDKQENAEPHSGVYGALVSERGGNTNYWETVAF